MCSHSPAGAASNLEAGNNNVLELQQEISNLQHQIRIAEEQLRQYEPDPMAFSSLAELESCEKNLMDIYSRVTQRKKFILSNHMSSYDPSNVQLLLEGNEGMPGSFESEVIGWLPENTQSQMFGAASDHHHHHPSSAAAMPSSTAIYDYESLSHAAATTGNLQDPNSLGGSCSHVADQGQLPPWHLPYSSADHLLSTLLPPTSFPLIKCEQEMGITATSSMMTNQQGEAPQPDCPTLQCSEEDKLDEKLKRKKFGYYDYV
ncbi:hypothetical protein V2J09_003198 [Rumex salicifolius]